MQIKESHNDIDRLIVQYLSEHINEAEMAELRRWINQSEENRNYVRGKLELWFSSGVSGDPTLFDEKEAFMRFRQRIMKEEKQEKPEQRFSWKYLYRAAVVLLIVLLPLAYWGGKETVKQTFTDIVVEAPLGARTKLFLPDGTLVWLNAASKIVYSQGFGVGERKLSLVGEGYFEVARDENVPFEIQTKELSLKVLGTKFNFRNYPDDEEVTVNLIEGKVAVRNELKVMPELCLEPNEKMVLNKLTGMMIKSAAHAEFVNAWTNDELFFDEELLKDIAKKLMRSYDVEIEVADSLKNKRFYGCFKIMGNTIDEVLEIISATKQMHYRYENGKYILY